MARRLEERDLRSLERPSMYTIFKPLDPDERLPRELLMEARRYRPVGRRELAGALWLPALWLVLAFSGWVTKDGLAVLGIIALMYAGFWGFVLFGRPRA
ncbi:MAG TPA: hypothetical protein VJT78_13575 [Candidatus Dormibacteraeota bacterium]|nr:hypothetical protein [Candidatus Dormibacteraeota bacterium]